MTGIYYAMTEIYSAMTEIYYAYKDCASNSGPPDASTTASFFIGGDIFSGLLGWLMGPKP